jgi:hypothetical protein
MRGEFRVASNYPDNGLRLVWVACSSEQFARLAHAGICTPHRKRATILHMNVYAALRCFGRAVCNDDSLAGL